MWCNPPYEDLDAVVAKIQMEGAKAILIAPEWEDEPFYKMMFEMEERHYYYKPGTYLFELDGYAVPLRKWGVYAMLVKGGKIQDPKTQEPQHFQKTSSSRRRHRRSLEMEAKRGKK